MFLIDFTKPWIYDNVVYFNQGNLSTNNTLRCRIITGGSDDFTGGCISCTFKAKGVEINAPGNIIDHSKGVIEIVFPSNALVVGKNQLELLVSRKDKSLAQSPIITYEVWKGITTDEGIKGDSNYPILVELINTTKIAIEQINQSLEIAENKIPTMNEIIVEAQDYMSVINENSNKVDATLNRIDSELDIIKYTANKKIEDIDRMVSSGTNDLELIQARRDIEGIIHNTLEKRLNADLNINIFKSNTIKQLSNSIKEIENNLDKTEKDLRDFNEIKQKVKSLEENIVDDIKIEQTISDLINEKITDRVSKQDIKNIIEEYIKENGYYESKETMDEKKILLIIEPLIKKIKEDILSEITIDKQEVAIIVNNLIEENNKKIIDKLVMDEDSILNIVNSSIEKNNEFIFSEINKFKKKGIPIVNSILNKI